MNNSKPADGQIHLPAVSFIRYLLCKQNTQANPFNEASPLMIPAEFTDRVDDLVHLPERHSVHLLVELVEICADQLVVIGLIFVEAFI